MVKVLNSRELRSIDLKSIPDAVILAFNTLIVKNWSGKASEFKQSDVPIHRRLIYAISIAYDYLNAVSLLRNSL